jgi:TonB family protein
MVEQTPVNEPEPEPAPAKMDEPPPAALGTNVQGSGAPDGFGLASGSGGGGGMGGAGGLGRGRGGSKYGWYAGQVQSRIAEAMRQNSRTKSATMSVQVRIWADANGLVTRAAIASSSGDADLDRTIRDEVLTGLRLQQPPPADMPMPIVLRLTARRPG